MKKLLENLKTDEFKAIHLCFGGERVRTGYVGDATTPCTADSQERTETQVAGMPEGNTQPDYSDWKDECIDGQPSPFWLTLAPQPITPNP